MCCCEGGACWLRGEIVAELSGDMGILGAWVCEGILGFLVLTSTKVWGIVVMLGPRGEVLRVWLVLDDVSTGADAIILPLFLLSQVWPVVGIERVMRWDLVLEFG